jgi:hypothetical protein
MPADPENDTGGAAADVQSEASVRPENTVSRSTQETAPRVISPSGCLSHSRAYSCRTAKCTHCAEVARFGNRQKDCERGQFGHTGAQRHDSCAHKSALWIHNNKTTADPCLLGEPSQTRLATTFPGGECTCRLSPPNRDADRRTATARRGRPAATPVIVVVGHPSAG